MSEGVELRFTAAVHSIEKGVGERLATFYVMDTSVNRNNWRVTDEALEEALPTLMGRSLSCIPGYRVNHVHEPIQVGRWIKVDKPDGYALATAEITDDVAWKRLGEGEWGPVSVVIRASKVTCSGCGEDITGAPCEHIKAGEAHEIVGRFVFDRVDFVSVPAYPQADLMRLGQATRISRRSQSNVDGAQGPRGIDPAPEGKEEKRMEELAEIRNELERVKAEKEALRSENEELHGRVETLEAERHGELVDATLEARVKAGLVDNRVAEAARLKGLDAGALGLLREDAARVAGRTFRVEPGGPKARYGGSSSGYAAAVEDARLRLFGFRRGADGGVA